MKKRTILIVLLCAALIVLSGCQQQKEEFEVAGSNVNQGAPISQMDLLAEKTPTPEPEPVIDWDDGEYDPESEEDEGDDALNAGYLAAEMVGEDQYAGATPIPIDPIDLPTPTPRPELVFSYTAYNPGRLSLSFEAPNDWEITQDDVTTFTLTDPNTRDGVNASVSVTLATVGKSYKLNDLKKDLNNTLSEMKKEYMSWETKVAAERAIMGYSGYYNRYTGTMSDGTKVSGLISMALMNNQVITIHLQEPAGFQSSYEKIYSKIRNTIKENK